ncbi:methyltransferase, FkbM family [Roseovarius azorensis]|uniref:Methyltransferase, FkbM family n=1 Tax=Roseovarius azorensis TaxID=1287727 RepID=A0A1H7F8C0_9RHOB|nr:FkbM family methyltransferase [Roseovarius azorensis]SEK22363.1 methyltransferase, FkbM family [Roseovarius azorensis]
MNVDTIPPPKNRHLKQIIDKGGPIGAVARLSQYSDRSGAVLDIGVNRGTMALYLCRLFSDLPIHLIEPIPAQCDHVTTRFARFPMVRVHQLALSNETGTREFLVADHLGSSSFFTNTGPEAALHSDHRMREQITVKTARLDDWCADQQISHISAMKIDAQGSEYNILQGAEHMLGKQGIDILMLEWFATPHYDGVPLLDELWGLLRGHGYSLYDLFPSRRFRNGQLRFGDAVFVSGRFLKTRLPDPRGNPRLPVS